MKNFIRLEIPKNLDFLEHNLPKLVLMLVRMIHVAAVFLSINEMFIFQLPNERSDGLVLAKVNCPVYSYELKVTFHTDNHS